MRPLLSVREAARLLNVTESTVYRLTKVGSLPHLRVGRSIRFSEEILDEYIKNPAPVTHVTTTRVGPVVTRL